MVNFANLMEQKRKRDAGERPSYYYNVPSKSDTIPGLPAEGTVLASITGTVESVLFSNHENGFTIAKFLLSSPEVEEPVTIKGYMRELAQGEKVEFSSGKVVFDQKYGWQIASDGEMVASNPDVHDLHAWSMFIAGFSEQSAAGKSGVAGATAELVTYHLGENVSSVFERIENETSIHLEAFLESRKQESEDESDTDPEIGSDEELDSKRDEAEWSKDVRDFFEMFVKSKTGKQIMEPLLSIPGVGGKRASALMEGWIRNKKKKDTLLTLYSMGLNRAETDDMWRRYRLSAPRILGENPYIMYFNGKWRFDKADSMALRTGLPVDSSKRLLAFMAYSLRRGESEGHSMLPVERVAEEGADKLGVAEDVIFDFFETLETSSQGNAAMPVRRGDFLLSAKMDRAENSVADFLSKAILSSSSIPEHIRRRNEDEANEKVKLAESTFKAETGCSLDASQKKALSMLFNETNRIVILTGGPGTGKTTIMRMFARFAEKDESKMIFCASTGAAAKRLSFSIGMETETLHSAAGIIPSKTESKDPNKIDNSSGIFFESSLDTLASGGTIVVDESGMTDIETASMLFNRARANSVHPTFRFIFVGDPDQIPSVGAGTFLEDLISLSPDIPVAKLSTIHRQKDGGITKNAAIINHVGIERMERRNKGLPAGRCIDKLSLGKERDDEFFWFGDKWFASEQKKRNEEYHSFDEAALERLLELVCERFPNTFGYDPLTDIRVLLPMKKGNIGTYSVNRELQKRLNPVKDGEPTLSSTIAPGFVWEWRLRDPVICLKNNRKLGVINGERGTVDAITKHPDSGKMQLEVLYDNGVRVKYSINKMAGLILPSYAMTMHKSQGSEYKVVVSALSKQHWIMLRKKLLFTCVTRAQEKCVLFAPDEVMEKTLRSVQDDVRWGSVPERVEERLHPERFADEERAR